MGLLDYTAKVLMQVKADTSDAKAKIKELTGEEKKLAQAELQRVEAQNKSLEEHKGRLEKLGVAIAGIGAAYLALSKSFEHMAQKQRLQTQAAGVDIDRLAKAAGGLRTNMELLEFAARTNNGTFKLTQAQMETVVGAMRSLERRGYESSEVFDKLTEAVRESKLSALEPFGIVLESTGDKSKDLQAMLAALAGEAKNVEGATYDAGEEYKRLGVEFSNAMDDIKSALGQLATAFGPVLGALAEGLSFLAKYASYGMTSLSGGLKSAATGKALKELARADTPKGRAIRDIMSAYGVNEADAFGMYEAMQGANAPQMPTRDKLRAASDPYKVAGAGADEARAKLESDVKAAVAKYGYDEAERLAIASGPGTLAIFNRVAGPRPSARKRTSGGGGRSAPSQPETSWGGGRLDLGEMAPMSLYAPSATGGIVSQALDVGAPIERATYALTEFQAKYEELRFGEGRSMLTAIFGEVTEFDAYATAWQALSGAVTAGFTAWVDGSKSFGAAMKEALKASLTSIAADMFGRSLQHAAMAIGSLAFGDFRGAAQHGIAAAKFGAGALAVGVLARNVGGGVAGAGAGAYSGGGAGAAAQSLPGWSPAQNTSRSVTLVIGDDFAEDSPRKRAQKAGRYLQMGLRQVGATGVSYA